MYEARVMHEMTGEAQRVFGEMRYRTLGSGSRERRVVAKAEHNGFGANPRFVVTSVAAGEMDCEALYEDFHCARGDMENRIKEQQLDMFADRTSTARMHANQLRLYFASFAYVLMQTLRRVGLAGTELAKAQCGTSATRCSRSAPRCGSACAGSGYRSRTRGRARRCSGWCSPTCGRCRCAAEVPGRTGTTTGTAGGPACPARRGIAKTSRTPAENPAEPRIRRRGHPFSACKRRSGHPAKPPRGETVRREPAKTPLVRNPG